MKNRKNGFVLLMVTTVLMFTAFSHHAAMRLFETRTHQSPLFILERMSVNFVSLQSIEVTYGPAVRQGDTYIPATEGCHTQNLTRGSTPYILGVNATIPFNDTTNIYGVWVRFPNTTDTAQQMIFKLTGTEVYIMNSPHRVELANAMGGREFYELIFTPST